MSTCQRALVVAVVTVLSMMPSYRVRAQTVADFYRGKTINLLIGSGAGGGYDTYGRALARFFGRHVPGNPAVVPQNLLGGAGVKMLTSLYNIAPKDGTSIGTSTPIAVLEPLFGDKNLAPYEPEKFTWLGNMDKDSSACGASRGSGITSFDDVLKRNTTFGASTRASILYQQPLVLKEMLGAPIKIVNGYKGTNEIVLAMRRGEVDVVCALFVSTAKADYGADVASGDLRFIIQFGETDDPFFGDAVNVHRYLKTDEQREIAKIIFRQVEITRPFMAPPGVPAEIAAALRKAFMDTMADPQFLEFAQRAGLTIKPASGEEVARQFAYFFNVPAPMLAKARTFMGGK